MKTLELHRPLIQFIVNAFNRISMKTCRDVGFYQAESTPILFAKQKTFAYSFII